MTDTEPLGRCLRLLGILQARAAIGAQDLARRLGVTTRTVRRDVERLRALGYRIDSAAGSGGGYRLASGPQTPMLVLEPDEAEAVALALAQAADSGLSGMDEPALSALLKIRRTMPPELAARAERIHRSTAVAQADADPPSYADVALLAEAAATGRSVRFRHHGREGADQERRVDPYRVVVFARRWYLFGWCLLRQDWRTFRIDRITGLHVTTFPVGERPVPDPVARVREAVLRAPYPVLARVVVAASPGRLRELIPPNAAQVEPWEADGTGDHALVTTGAEDASLLALHLARLGLPMQVIDPPELLGELQRLGEQLRGTGMA
ncbi:helix-turn-helix transcriptional regulator [Sediminivirga luteola]|uniref:helix-turn-helix transcriptional regulator n=1 Tax=Sediminivirga luteola TaxID=1774748 RepID=UPI001F583EE8|nr:WYL domain-containing protein [Sediminivirga luteola]MCI2264124.1 WYL domain-containing protein [Sediminivirga luteola]